MKSIMKTVERSFTIMLFLATSGAGAQTFEAEDGVLAGTVTATAIQGYSGTGYVTGFDNEGDSVTIRVSVRNAGLYLLTVRYAGTDGEKWNRIAVNGSGQGEIHFPATEGFQDRAVLTLWLDQGINQVRVEKSWGWFAVDAIRIDPAPVRPSLRVPGSLVNPTASREARALMTFLAKHYGKKILSGQYGWKEMEWIHKKTGKRPAILGLDMMDYSPSRVTRGARSRTVEEAQAWHRMGGIVTLCWHWNAPKDLIDNERQPWWSGFYTRATTFDVENALVHPDGESYALLLRDIDAIAVQLKRLQKARIPVLWRPLHEAEGRWFWWGAKGSEPCKKLWRLLYERLTFRHGLDNLIWVWTTSADASAPDWYPGDDVVDTVGCDVYLGDGDHGSVLSMFHKVVDLYGGRKLVAMTENGPIPDPAGLRVQSAGWSWFCTWSGDYIYDGKKNGLNFLKRTYRHPDVMTLDRLPRAKSVTVKTPARKP